MKYELPKLKFAQDSLEPYMDAKTVQVHYGGHHKTYVEKLNEAMKPYPDLQVPVEELLASLPNLPKEIQTPVRNNGGGHANHTLFWSILTPGGKVVGPTDALAAKMEGTFGSFADFKKKFTALSVEHFSNGWTWLSADTHGALELHTTKDHESPITQGKFPLLTLDLWEHAYYLKHQNRRPEFVEAFWNLVDWKEVGRRWEEFSRTAGARKAG